MTSIDRTDFPTAINFLFTLITLGVFGFYFLYKESEKNGFFWGNREQNKVLLAVGAAVYLFSTLLFNWLSLSGSIGDNALSNLFLYGAILAYAVIYIFGYFYLNHILRSNSEEQDLTFIGVLLFIALGTIYISIRQNQIASGRVIETKGGVKRAIQINLA